MATFSFSLNELFFKKKPRTLPKLKDGKTFSISRFKTYRRFLWFPSAEGRLPESLHFADSDVILGVVRARSVHKIGYGRNWDWAAA